MQNAVKTESYRFVDYVMQRAVRSLSRVIGVRNITRPFWNRWRASLLGEETIMQFLQNIGSIDEWPTETMRMVRHEAESLESARDTLTTGELIGRLRRLSYLCHMAQWGCLPICEEKISSYRLARDYYIDAETLAHNGRYHRVKVPWKNKQCWGNLHLPATGANDAPLIVIVHGMDDTKEEHLSTELGLQEDGFAVFCFDGPGQAESLLIEDLYWDGQYTDAVSAALDVLEREKRCRTDSAGVVGISWGGLWSFKMAAADPRIRAVFDLGGPIDDRLFNKLPFFLKAKFAQTLGVNGPEDIPDAATLFSIKDDAILRGVTCPVRIVHGRKDPLVPLGDKQWLCDRLKTLHPDGQISLRVFPDGDHCCTGHAAAVRADAVEFFRAAL